MRVQSWRTALAVVFALVACIAEPGELSARRAVDPGLLEQQIDELHGAGRFAEVLPLARRLVALNKARYGTVSTQHAAALEKLARTYLSQNQYAEAEPIYTQVLAIRTKMLGAHDASVLSTIVALAELYRFGGRPQMGEPLLREGLAQRERAVGPNHASLVDALRELAETERSLQRYGEAETDIRRALVLAKKAKQDPKQIALLLGARATIELDQHKVTEAERSLQDALSLHDQALRTDPTPQNGHVLTLGRVVS